MVANGFEIGLDLIGFRGADAGELTKDAIGQICLPTAIPQIGSDHDRGTTDEQQHSDEFGFEAEGFEAKRLEAEGLKAEGLKAEGLKRVRSHSEEPWAQSIFRSRISILGDFPTENCSPLGRRGSIDPHPPC